MEEIGEVVSVRDNQAVVRIKRKSACDRCGLCHMKSGDGEILLVVPNNLNARAGDRVLLRIRSTQVLKAAAVVYIFPLVALLSGIVGGYLLSQKLHFDPNMGGAIAGLLLVALAFGAIKILAPIFRKKNNFSPQIISIIDSSIEEHERR